MNAKTKRKLGRVVGLTAALEAQILAERAVRDAEAEVLRDVRSEDFPAAETRQRLFDADKAYRRARARVARLRRAR